MTESFRPLAESKNDDDDDSEKSGSSKNKKTIYLGKVAEKALEKQPEKSRSLWERGSPKDKDRQEGLLAWLNEGPIGTKPETPKDKSAEELQNIPLEELTPKEEKEAVRQYTEARLADIQAEATEHSAADEEKIEEAADAVLLENIRQEIDENPDKSVSELLDAAEATTVEQIDSDTQAAEEEELHESDVPASIEDIPEAEIVAETDKDTEEDPAGATASAGTATGPASPTPPTGPAAGAGGGSGPGGPAAGGGGGVPPVGPTRYPVYGGGVPPLGGGHGSYASGMHGPAFNTAPTTPSRAPETYHADERRALAQGLLVGGIVGYLIGRRRGRIKTEKKLAPIQKKLEKQVGELHASVAEREQKIRTLAAEKAYGIKTVEQKHRFAERLQSAASVTGASRERYVTSALHKGRAEQLGRVLVEAPAAAVFGAAAFGEMNNQERKATGINFDRKVEDYTTQELAEAAEKIRIDNTSLKELYDTGRLDERAVRRVMTEFVEGKSVRAAVGRELLQKEMRFERDPKLRDTPVSTGYSSGGSGSGGTVPVVATTAAALLIEHTGQAGQKTQESSASQKKADKKDDNSKNPLGSMSKEEIVQTAAYSTVIIIVFAVLIALVA